MANTNKLILSLLAGAVLFCLFAVVSNITDLPRLFAEWRPILLGMAGGALLAVGTYTYWLIFIPEYFYAGLLLALSLISLFLLTVSLIRFFKHGKFGKVEIALTATGSLLWCITGYNIVFAIIWYHT